MTERDEILLNVLADSDEEEEFDSVPHRTLDEILNDSYSSSSSPSSPPSNHNRQSHLLDFSQDLSESLKVVQSLIVDDDKSDHQSTVSNQEKVRSSSGLLTSRVSSSSRPLPSLFTGVKSNGKPGAALAAAVAASRSVPTPHAAAIKSRRRLLDTRDSDSIDVEYEAVSNGNSNSNSIVFGTASAENEAHMDDSILTRDGNSDSLLTTVVEPVLSTEDSRFSNDDHQEASDSAVTSTTIDCENRQDASETDTHSSPGVDEDVLIKKDYENEGNMTMVPSEEVDGLEEVVHTPGDTVGSQEESGSVSDISELVEERIGQLENERMSKIAEKKLRPPLKPLELAEELEKKQAFTGLHWEEGAAAQPMRLEGVRRGSTTLGYFYIDSDNVVTGAIASQQLRWDYGSAHVLAVHLNYIAVGTAKGVIVVFPSRYSTHSPDVTDAKMLILGLQGDRSLSPVTSMCFNQQGDLLLAGYDDGHVTVWDMQKAAAAKVITGEHNAPVVHTMFLGQEYQASRQFKAVTGDSKGLVLLHAFSVVPLINRFSIKTQCLLDGQKTGTVLTASPLLFDESCGNVLPSPVGNTSVASSSIGSMMGGVVGADAGWKLFNEGSSLVEEGVVIFATYQTALVVKLTPNLEVYAQISKPEGVREGSMPYTAWKCTTQSKSSSTDASERVSLLAIAWDRKVEVAKLIKSELKVYGKWSIDSTAVGVAWLDTHLLVVLTLAGQLYLFGKDGTPIHQTSFSIHVSGGDNLLAYHTHFLNIYGNPEKAYHNSIAVRGASIYILGPMHLIVCRLLPWKERIQVLRSAGDWMGALNMAMTLYDGQAHGVIDLPRSVDAVRESIMPYLLELLLSYVDEVFSYISVAFCNQREKVEHKEDLKSGGSSVHVEIKEQFTRVGGVAVEFCVHIQRTDILFDEIFSKFIAVQQKDTFLELLEPYILRDMLGTLPPEIMQALVEHYSSKGWLHRVEQCVLHMDISSLDFNQVVRLCREHALYGALIYLFNKGLDDFKTPLEELLVVLQKCHTENTSILGYRILVYLKYCFSGLAFPPGHGTLPSTRVSSLRAELVQFLLENSNSQTLQAAQCMQSRGTYLNLYHLLELDTEATLDVLKCAFEDDKTQNPDFSLHDSTSSNLESKQEYMMSASQNILVQNTVDALVHIIERYAIQADDSASTGDAESGEMWPTRKDVGHVFEFIGCYVACRNAYVSKSVLNQILEYLTSGSNLPTSTHVQVVGTSKSREKQVLALIQVVPVADWNASYVLQLCERAGFHQVCGFIHSIRHQYLPALESYVKDVDEPIHAFSYINDLLEQLSGNQYKAFRRALVSMIPELVVLSREGTFFLVMDHFKSETDHVLSELRSHPKSLFLYLKTVIEVHLSGTLDFHNLRRDSSADVYNGRIGEDQNKRLETYLEKITKFSKLVRNNVVNVTDDMIELYLELLCQYEPNSVLRFLETFDSYRVEHCLRLCQEYGIIDAAAFLLERVGDVGSALLFRISGLDDKFAELDKAVGNIASGKAFSSSTSIKRYHTLSNMKEVNDIRSILQACIGLCQRNTLRLMPEESEALWFKLLDSFCEPLMESYDNKGAYEVNNGFGVLIENQSTRNDDVVCVIKWKISKSHKGARVLRKLFSQFIKEIVEGMIGYVRLPTIMSKLLSDDGNQELGDFKITILGMLGTYGFERRILDTAKSVIEDDTFYAMSLLKKGASHGYAPRGLACCICNCLLSKGSSTFSVRVFSCGHATHLQCELLENESPSRGSLSGCPICMPKKNAERAKNKSALPDDGLIDQVSTRPPRAQGPYLLHPHEDLIENSYGLQHISRFEMLSNLQREQRFMQMEIMPQLKLAPPAVYQERAQKGPIISAGESSSLPLSQKPFSQKPTKQLSELKVKGSSSLRFPLKSNIFGKEKKNRY